MYMAIYMYMIIYTHIYICISVYLGKGIERTKWNYLVFHLFSLKLEQEESG